MPVMHMLIQGVMSMKQWKIAKEKGGFRGGVFVMKKRWLAAAAG